MKKLMLSIFAIAAFGFSVSAENNTAKVSDATAGGEIVAPITLTNGGTVLEFGRIARGASGTGTITILPASGDQTATAAVSGVDRVLGVTRQATAFTVGGQVGLAYGVTLPANGSAFAAGITIDYSHSATGTIAIAGGDVFYVGGTLHIDNATAQVGAYTKTFEVTVTYN